MKELKDLEKSLSVDLSYDAAAKKTFINASKKFLKKVEKELNLPKAQVRYNPSGVAVSGDATYMGMFDENHGVYVLITQSMGAPCFMYRSITGMRDFHGGTNRYISLNKGFTFEEIIEKLRKVGQ